MKALRRLAAIPFDVVFLQISVVAFIVLAFLQIFTRYVLNAPLPWTEEVATFFLIWLTHVGAWTLLRQDSHVRLELIDEFVGPGVRRWVHTLWDIVIAAILVAIIFAGWEILPQLQYDRTPALQVSYSVVMAIIPITSALMLMTVILRVTRTVLGIRGGR